MLCWPALINTKRERERERERENHMWIHSQHEAVLSHIRITLEFEPEPQICNTNGASIRSSPSPRHTLDKLVQQGC